MNREVRCPFFGLPVEVDRRRVPASGDAWVERVECRSAGALCPTDRDCPLRTSHPASARAPDLPSRYEIRIEGLGGMGANLVGRLLSDACVAHLDCYATNFASYGSEKKGSPVKSYLRLSEDPIRDAGPVLLPDVLAVFHEALLDSPGVRWGIRPDITLLVATPRSPEDAAHRFAPLPVCRLAVIDAARVAREAGARPNMVLLGAISSVLDFLPPSAVERALEAKFRGDALARNREAFRRGLGETRVGQVEGTLRSFVAPDPHRAIWGYANAPLGGVAPEAAGSLTRNVSALREGSIPVLDRARCTDCGLCEISCPDYCFVWAEGAKGPVLRGIDYQYCKGCMRCVDVCPPRALVETEESLVDAEALRIPFATGAGAHGS